MSKNGRRYPKNHECVACGGKFPAMDYRRRYCPDCVRTQAWRNDDSTTATNLYPPFNPYARIDPQDITNLTPPEPDPNTDITSGPLYREPFGRPADDPRNRKSLRELAKMHRIDDGKQVSGMFRTAFLDIEATGLEASFGRVLSCVIFKTDPSEKWLFRADQYDSWKRGQRSDDSQMVADIFAVLEDADTWVGHNIVRYDQPFLTARAMATGLNAVVPRFVIDPCQILRKKARFKSNGQGYIAQDLNLAAEKTPIEHKYWVAATMDGSSEALDYIVEHNIKDVEQLIEITERIRPWITNVDRIGSFSGR